MKWKIPNNTQMFKIDSRRNRKSEQTPTSEEIKSVIKKLLTKISPEPGGFNVEFCCFKKNQHQSFANSSKKYKKREHFQSHSLKPTFRSDQSLSRVRLCNPMNHSTPGLPVHHQLPEFTQTHIHRVSDAIQLSHPLSSPSPAPNPSQHQSLFQ